MITVKLYGLLRIESGIREKQLEASTVAQVLEALADCGIPRKDLEGYVILVNGKNARKRKKHLTTSAKGTKRVISPAIGRKLPLRA